MKPEDQTLIKEMIRRQLNIILFGSAGAGDTQTEDINDLFPGMPTIEARPVMHPYGFVSVAPTETISVVVRVGEHAGNRMVIGHRDAKRPADFAKGESGLYNAFGQRVYLKDGKILIGSGGAAEPVVLGLVILEFFDKVMTQLDTLLQTLEGTPAGLTTVPGNPIAPNPAFVQAVVQIKTALTEAKSTYISDAGTNIVSKEVFVERGSA